MDPITVAASLSVMAAQSSPPLTMFPLEGLNIPELYADERVIQRHSRPLEKRVVQRLP